MVDDRKSLSTFTTGYIDVKLPFGIKYRFNGDVNLKYYSIGQFQATNTTKRMGALDWSFGEYQHTVDYTLENILTWDYSFNNIHILMLPDYFPHKSKSSQRTTYQVMIIMMTISSIIIRDLHNAM